MVAKEQITAVGDRLLVLAPAKINLSLLIAGKRPDGFHEIDTVMAKIDFCDQIVFEPGQRDGIELVCEGPQWAPTGKDNLIWRAAEMLLASQDRTANLRITLTKNIPAGAGLGSASSDAAATLIGLNHYFHLEISKRDMFDMATTLGSDVAFFLNGPLAICKGKGEKIQKIEEKFDFTAILVLPDISVSTKKVYSIYNHRQQVYEDLRDRINGHIAENRIDLVAAMCANMLEESCFNLAGSLAMLKEECGSLNIAPFCLSGSGSAMFCILKSGEEDKAGEYKRRLEEKVGCTSIVVTNNRW